MWTYIILGIVTVISIIGLTVSIIQVHRGNKK